MANGIRTSVSVAGLDALRRALRQLPEELQSKAMGDAAAAGARVIRNEARNLVPVATGTLRNQIRSTRGVRRGSESSAFVSVRTLNRGAIAKFKLKHGSKARNPNDAFYWRFVEFGTSKMVARPFLRPAFDTKKLAAVEEFRKVLALGIEKAAAKLAAKGAR